KIIASISLLSLTFKSDHALLKDYTADWKDGGARFLKPEWTPARQHPISHTMDKQVTVELELEVGPPDACQETGILRGEGPDSMVFEKKGVTFKAGKFKLQLTSDQKVPKKIQELVFQVNWSTQGTSAALSATTSNVMYSTMDTPTTPRWP